MPCPKSTAYMKSNQKNEYDFQSLISYLLKDQVVPALKAVGVIPVYFLKAVLKLDLELKPTSYITSSTVSLVS